MPTRTKAPKKGSSSKGASAIRSGPLPPYGVAIRDATARGSSPEMKKLAASTRRYLTDVQAALDKLEKALDSKKR
jgi:hypothetical protein